MLTGWGLLLPTGVIIAKVMKHRPDAFWFKVHRTVQPLGLCCTVVGLAVALANFRVFVPNGGARLAHGSMGVVVMTLGLLQPLNAFFRPHNPEAGQEKSRARQWWEYVHKGSGYTAVGLAGGTIVLGTFLPPQLNSVYLALYAAVVCLLAGLLTFAYCDKRRYQKLSSNDVSEL
jgi:hypothetical protein